MSSHARPMLEDWTDVSHEHEQVHSSPVAGCPLCIVLASTNRALDSILDVFQPRIDVLRAERDAARADADRLAVLLEAARQYVDDDDLYDDLKAALAAHDAEVAKRA